MVGFKLHHQGIVDLSSFISLTNDLIIEADGFRRHHRGLFHRQELLRHSLRRIVYVDRVNCTTFEHARLPTCLCSQVSDQICIITVIGKVVPLLE